LLVLGVGAKKKGHCPGRENRENHFPMEKGGGGLEGKRLVGLTLGFDSRMDRKVVLKKGGLKKGRKPGGTGKNKIGKEKTPAT